MQLTATRAGFLYPVINSCVAATDLRAVSRPYSEGLCTLKETSSIFITLDRILEKPAPFSVYTANNLWTDSHTSQRMLEYHLNPDIDVSSRRHSFIDRSVEWMIDRFKLSKASRIIDFGCGPGLYTSRLASCGGSITGIDFSPTSISYAKVHSPKSVEYHQTNYLKYKPSGKFDLIIMIMCDFCALSPSQRSTMLHKFSESLSDDGFLILDVYSLSAFAQKNETIVFEKDLLNGFWAPRPYCGFQVSYKYDAEKVSLDKYTIIKETHQCEVYNWLQYFSSGSLEIELSIHDLTVESLLGDVAGHSYNPDGSEFAVIVKKK
jgi:SAM-dependent methyltransferase